MVQIKWTLVAQEDLKGIFDFIARNSKKYAQIEVLKLKTRTQILKTNPFAGKTLMDINNPLIRELAEGNYRIIYKITRKNQIDVLTIHHAARDLSGRLI